MTEQNKKDNRKKVAGVVLAASVVGAGLLALPKTNETSKQLPPTTHAVSEQVNETTTQQINEQNNETTQTVVQSEIVNQENLDNVTETKSNQEEVSENTNTSNDAVVAEAPKVIQPIITEEGQPNPQVNVDSQQSNETSEQSQPVTPTVEYTHKTRTETVVLPFTETVVQDNSMLKGTSRVVQEGQNGQKVIFYKQTFANDVFQSEVVESTMTTDPVNKVVHVGTQEPKKDPVIEVSTVTETLSETLDTIIQEDNTKPQGYRETIVKGQPQISQLTYEVTKADGVEQSRVLKNTTITQKGVAPVVVVGTMVVKTTQETTTETVAFNTVNEDDPNMNLGDTKVVQEGVNGIRTIVTEHTEVNGVHTKSEVISNTITKQPINRVIKRGTRLPLNVETLNDLSETQGFIQGAKLVNGDLIKYMAIRSKFNLADIKAMPEDDRYQLAKNSNFNVNGNYLTVQKPDGTEKYRFISLTKGSIDFVNNNLDVDLLNKYMLELVNKERVTQGRQPLTYGTNLQQGADVRALEQAEIGNLRSNGKAHTRPDGTSHNTAFEYLGTTVGENIAQANSYNPYMLMSEKALAEKLFTQWKSSKGHYANMMNRNHKTMAFSVKLGLYNDYSTTHRENDNSIIGVQIFK